MATSFFVSLFNRSSNWGTDVPDLLLRAIAVYWYLSKF